MKSVGIGYLPCLCPLKNKKSLQEFLLFLWIRSGPFGLVSLAFVSQGFFREINPQVFACHHMTRPGAWIDVISTRHTSENFMWFSKIQDFINSSSRGGWGGVCVSNEPQGVLSLCQEMRIIPRVWCWAAPRAWWRSAKRGSLGDRELYKELLLLLIKLQIILLFFFFFVFIHQ